MNIFNYLSNILFTKKQPTLQGSEQLGDYEPYLINRWCSMLNTTTCNLINTTVNSMFTVFEDKSTHYKFLHYILPRQRFSRINYIKKTKSDPPGQNKTIEMLAKNLEISKREINLYRNQLNLDLTKYEPTKSKH